MTQEEKFLLLQDLCARLPYRIKVHYDMNADPYWDGDMSANPCWDNGPTGDDNLRGFSCGYFELDYADGIRAECIKPYLRSMSSMTEEEGLIAEEMGCETTLEDWQKANYIDWLNAHHFDYRGLIEKGLALEAPEGMYN